jgi:asparagine synthase (glutamine-hydrolysing)
MCGIAGFVDSKIARDEQIPVLSAMLQSIIHRGPDGSKQWYSNEVALGHNRLAIIDLTSDGDQPMHFRNSTIVFNGEIYNYVEIRKELIEKGYTFHTSSDTEVILVAYQEWGNECVQKFLGMWAFALWDENKQELFCSRDRFGIKPFYYIYQDGRFYFGSEYKALKKSPLFKNDLNLNQVARSLQMGWNTYHDETYFECLKQIPAGTNLIFKNGAIKEWKYWELSTNQNSNLSYDEAVYSFKSLFESSIDLHLRSDVEVGGCLSGGLDSSSIASVIGTKYSNVDFKTFTIYYEGAMAVDERPWVNKVVSQYPNLKPYYFTPTDDSIVHEFDRALYHADVPIAGSSPISQYFLMQLASQQNIKVLLDGQGSDECLAGYMHSFYRLIGGLINKGKIYTALKQWDHCRKMQAYSVSKSLDVFAKSLLSAFQSEQSLYNFEYKHYFPFLPINGEVNFNLENVQGSRLNQFLYHLLTNTLLPTLLQFEDRNSMAFSIESRVPFLDHRIVEFAFSLPDSFKLNDGVTKRILRDGLKQYLPEQIANRKDKKGFVTPGEVKWLRGPLSFLIEQDFSKIDFINTEKILSLVSDFKKGDNKNANLIWRVSVLKYWMERQ